MRRCLKTWQRSLSLVLIFCFTSACDESPAGPSAVGSVEQLVQAVRREGLNATLGGGTNANVLPFFTVAARPILVDGSTIHAFEYPSAEAAATDVTLMKRDGQPAVPTVITWVSTPRFYRRDQLIVLYVGCSPAIIEALDRTMGLAFAVGNTPCQRR